tara:strand:- start:116 stop:334 length:219 start_codon:yes stop_codon:yes gene_type:complete
MTNQQGNSIGTKIMLIVAIILIYIVSCTSCNTIHEITDKHIVIFVDVIEEDGVRWYTLDTIKYKSIDTTIYK